MLSLVTMNNEFEPFSTAQQLSNFQDKIRNYLMSEGYDNVIFEDMLVILDPSDKQKLSTWNIAQICAQTPDTEWNTIISDHFSNLFKAEAETVEYNNKKENFENVKSLLRLQLYPENYLEQVPFQDEIISRTDIQGTLSVLVIDLPSSVQSVKKSDSTVWDLSEQELFSIALENTLTAGSINHSSVDAGGFYLQALEGENILSAVQVFNLEKFNDCYGEHGSIVSIPTRHFILCYPINDLSVVKAIQTIAISTSGMNKSGPGSLSPYLYWYKDGVFKKQLYSLENNTFNFAPTEEFIAELNLLK
jgi:hypothetical protein